MKRTILVIDDDADFREMMRDTLEASGYHVRAFGAGREALDNMEAKIPDMIFLDLMIPGEDGFETCRKITGDARTAGVPVVILTGRTSVSNKLTGFCCGARRYLTKPCEIDDLLRAAEDVLGARPPAARVAV